MPSTRDDSSGSDSFSTPRLTAPEIPGNQARPEAGGDCWLGNYMVDRMTAAGIDPAVSRRVANQMQPDIVAVFTTLARLEPRGPRA